MKKVNTLDTAKASQQSDIPTKILKQNSDYFAEYFYENINQCISKSIFPSDLKLADVTPVYKKKSKNSKDNYRPVSILSNISKIYERCIYNQIQLFFDSLLSKYQCGFCRGYNAQPCLVSLIEKWKKSVDNGGAFGVLLTDLSIVCLMSHMVFSNRYVFRTLLSIYDGAFCKDLPSEIFDRVVNIPLAVVSEWIADYSIDFSLPYSVTSFCQVVKMVQVFFKFLTGD